MWENLGSLDRGLGGEKSALSADFRAVTLAFTHFLIERVRIESARLGLTCGSSKRPLAFSWMGERGLLPREEVSMSTVTFDELIVAGLCDNSIDHHLTIKGRDLLRALSDLETQEVVDQNDAAADLVLSTNGLFR